jgi:alkyl hydroperoxide reductase subunit AhpF
VAVIGGGNSAIGSALMIAEFASKVYIVNKNEELRGEDVLIDRVKKHDKIECLNSADTLKILGEKFVSGLEYKDLKSKETKQLELKGIFINVGWLPNADFIDWVKKNERGEIMIDEKCETDQLGIYAAGDVTNLIYKQFVIAAGQGAMAALRAIDFLNKH